MQIEVKGRNTPVTDDIRELVERRFRKVANQVSDLAVLEVEIHEERNPANPLSLRGGGDAPPQGRDAARAGLRA